MTSSPPLDGPMGTTNQSRTNPWSFFSGSAGVLLVVAGVVILLETRGGQTDPSLIRWNQMIGFGVVLLGAILSAACIAIMGVQYEINRALGRRG